jgi:hypothetical protein
VLSSPPADRMRRASAGMHRCPLHEIIPRHYDVDHFLNNNRIAAGLSPPRSVREGDSMSNGRLADPVSTRETLCQNMRQNRRIVVGPTALQWAVALHQHIAARRAVAEHVISLALPLPCPSR